MTVVDPRTESAFQALPEPRQAPTVEPPAETRPAPSGAPRHDLDLHEPPAGLGPWIPPLPEPDPRLSPRAATWFGIVAVTLIIACAAAIAVVIGAATAPSLSRSDGLYLDSVRDHSGLTSFEISDVDLMDTGHEVCGELDRRPSMSSVVTAMQQLGSSHGWNDDDVAAVVGSAIGAYCPRHMALVGA
jgi:Protein of unknown function (DUF732)